MKMQSAPVSPSRVCYYAIPKRFSFQHLQFPKIRVALTSSPVNSQTHFTNTHFLFPTATNKCICEQERRRQKKEESNSHADHKRPFLEELHTSSDDNSAANQNQRRQSQEGKARAEIEVEDTEVNSTNMWWADLKAFLGQRINLGGIGSSVAVFMRDRHLALPHVSVLDIRHIDWAALKRAGFQGVVFDKDNTITVPYSLTLWGSLESSMEECKTLFGNDIAVFSNSAGLYEFDPDGRKARALEGTIGIKVIRHRLKKPAGTAEEIEKQFGCESSRLIMVGDRPFTDVVFGNRNGFFTILTEPLSLDGEPFIVKQVRKVEIALVHRWSKKGLKPTSHGLLPNALLCVKDWPPL